MAPSRDDRGAAMPASRRSRARSSKRHLVRVAGQFGSVEDYFVAWHGSFPPDKRIPFSYSCVVVRKTGKFRRKNFIKRNDPWTGSTNWTSWSRSSRPATGGAARRLGRSAPAITRGLAALEKRAGLCLVERTTRHLAPTDAGRDLAEQARRLIADYEASVSAAAAAPLRGLLRVTAPVVFGRRHVTPVVLSFLDLHPEIDVELHLHDRNLDMIEETAASRRPDRPVVRIPRWSRAGSDLSGGCWSLRPNIWLGGVVPPAPTICRSTTRSSQRVSARRTSGVSRRVGRVEGRCRCGWRPAFGSTRSRRLCRRLAPGAASPACCRIRWRPTWRRGEWSVCCATSSRIHCRYRWSCRAGGPWPRRCVLFWTMPSVASRRSPLSVRSAVSVAGRGETTELKDCQRGHSGNLNLM